MTTAQTPHQRLAALHELKAHVERQINDLTRRINAAGRPPRKRRSRHERPSCGTEAGYQWHRYRKDFSCVACRAAHSTHVSAWKTQKRRGGS